MKEYQRLGEWKMGLAKRFNVGFQHRLNIVLENRIMRDVLTVISLNGLQIYICLRLCIFREGSGNSCQLHTKFWFCYLTSAGIYILMKSPTYSKNGLPMNFWPWNISHLSIKFTHSFISQRFLFVCCCLLSGLRAECRAMSKHKKILLLIMELRF